jgi:hypothetical protein
MLRREEGIEPIEIPQRPSVTDRTVAWDADNRPIEVVANSNTVDYLYGPDGKRLKKVVGSDTTRAKFAADRQSDRRSVRSREIVRCAGT